MDSRMDSGSVGGREMSAEEYVSFQISASEALRAGGNLEISREQRRAYFVQSAFYSAKAFVAAKDNVYHRFLAISQYQCAHSLILLVDTDYSASVDSVRTDFLRSAADPQLLKQMDWLDKMSVQEAMEKGIS